MILNDEFDLTAALHFYLDGLKNWNEALVYAVEKIGQYTSGKIVNDWLTKAGDRDNFVLISHHDQTSQAPSDNDDVTQGCGQHRERLGSKLIGV